MTQDIGYKQMQAEQGANFAERDDQFNDARIIYVNDCQYRHWEAKINGFTYHIRLTIHIPKIYTVTRLDSSGILWPTDIWAAYGDEAELVEALEATG